MSKMETAGELPKDFEEVAPVESDEDFDSSSPVGAGNFQQNFVPLL